MAAYVIFDVDIREAISGIHVGREAGLGNGWSQISGARWSAQGLRGRLGTSTDCIVRISVRLGSSS